MSDNVQIGYDPSFIGDGLRVPLPTFNRRLAQSVLRKPGVLRNDIYSDHIHFTVVMNEHTRQLIYSAYNIDQTKFRPEVEGKGKRGWRNDKDIGKENQLDNKYYADRKKTNGDPIHNPYDRGHMVMRFNNMWGGTNDESNKAGRATFVYANSSLQHKNLNRDEWKKIELKIVRPFSDDANDRLSVFTGPMFGNLDRHVNLTDQDSARVPSGFFKVICYRSKHPEPEKKLGVMAFAVFQDDEVIKDLKGASVIKINQQYQVTITELQQLTGINFGQALFDRNPLFFFDNPARNSRVNVVTVPERIPFITREEVISDHGKDRREQEHLKSRRIIINSAMINPKGDERLGEWISLHNRTNDDISVDGWKLIDGANRKAILRGEIKSGKSKKLTGNSKGKIQLSNTGGNLMLVDDHECIIDYVTWTNYQMSLIDEDVAFLFDNIN